MEKIEECKKLLSLFDKEVEKRSSTYFDVAGYPHYEKVVSNILAFFFDTEEEHGKKDLWLRSLLECYYEKKGEFVEEGIFYSTDGAVQREYSTANGKRIDLLITTDDNKVVVIENKIYSGVYNPFKEYHDQAQKDFKERELIEILLTLKPEKKQQQDDFCFENITYARLLAKVKENFGTYLSEGNEKWIIYMNEFMKNIGSKMEDSAVDGELQNIFRENGKQIRYLWNAITIDIESKLKFMNDAKDAINAQIHTSVELEKYNAHVYKKTSLSDGYGSIVVDFEKDEGHTLVYEPYFMNLPGKEGCEDGGILYLAIWDRKSKDIFDYKDLNEVFDNYKISVVDKTRWWGKWIILKQYDFEKIKVEDFAAESVEIIKKLAEL